MRKSWAKKGLLIGIVLLFVGTSVIPNITKNVKADPTEIFFDNFNNYIKDHSKWTEIYTDGTWKEINQRVEFKCYESGDSSNRYEGIQSSAFTVSLSSTESVIINWDVITKIAGTTSSVGQPRVRVTDGNNWIETTYERFYDRTKYRDSTYPQGEIWTILETGKGDGSWSNNIEIFSNRYSVTMDNVGSGPVDKTLFSSNPTFKVQIFIVIGGSHSLFPLRSGFDNVIVKVGSGGNQPLIADFIWIPQTPKPNQMIYFNTSSSYDPDGSLVSYAWDFDNDEKFDDKTGNCNTWWSWSNNGTYPVSLKVTDNGNVSYIMTKTIIVEGENQPPVANASGPYSAVIGESFTFSGFQSYDPDGSIVDYRWDFTNDSSWDTSWLTSPTREYTFYSEFHGYVKLQVKDDFGITSSATAKVDIDKLNKALGDDFLGSPGFELLFFISAIAISILLLKKKRSK